MLWKLCLSSGFQLTVILAVLCYQFPSYFTTTDLRAVYDAKYLQNILMFTMWASLGFAFITFLLAKQRRLGAIGVVFTLAGFALGGYTIETGSVEPNQLSLGLDWLILTLLASVAIFTFLEKIFPKYKEQAVLRPEWQLDLFYFCFNHLLIAVLLLIANYFVANVFGWAASLSIHSRMNKQLITILLQQYFRAFWLV